MITRKEMTCVECGSDNTRLEMAVSDGKKCKPRVYFKVECVHHGGFSHMLPNSEINLAVADYIEKMRNS